MPQPSVPVPSSLRFDLRRLRMDGETRELHRVLGQAITLDGPTARAAESQHPGVVARTVVVDALRRPALLHAELEIVLRRLGTRKQRSDGSDLFGRVVMRGAGDCELVVRQVVAGSHQRKRLQRLGGGAHEARQRRVARRGHDFARADSDCVNPVHRLDSFVPAHLDDDRLAHAREPYADLRMVDICRMVGRCRP